MSEIRVNYVINEAVSGGTPNVRVPYVINEAVANGTPNVRINFVFNEAVANGYPNVRSCFVFLESICDNPLELPMSTEPFPGFGNDPDDPSIPAGANPASSVLPGLEFSVHKVPMFKTNIKEAVSGAETRTSYSEYPRWRFELSYEFLEDMTGAQSSLRTIVGFFLQRHGSFDSWLFKDPDDYKVVEGEMATADGVTTQFAFKRDLGGFLEKVGQVDTDNDIDLYADGVLIDPADYTVTMPNLVVFDSAPADGVVLTSSFQFFFACRFEEDELDFEKFADKLWNLQECNFRSILQ